MEGTRAERQEQFFAWLGRTCSPEQMNTMRRALRDLEADLAAHRDMHHLRTSLLATEDADAVEGVYFDLKASPDFKRWPDAEKKLQLLRAYERFCRTDGTPIAEPDPESLKRNREAFIEWLRARHCDDAECLALYGTARKIDALLVEAGIVSGLFGVSDLNSVSSRVVIAKGLKAFKERDEAEDHLWTRAAEYYKLFMEGQKQTERAPNSSGEARQADTLQKEDFHQWLKAQHPDEAAEALINALQYAEQFARRNHIAGIHFFGVKPAIASTAATRMLASNALKKNNISQYRAFQQAARRLMEFASPQKKAEDASGEPSQSSQENALEPALMELLQHEKYAPLREALVQKGILTLAAFKALNFWVFMNETALYTIGERQSIASELRQALSPAPGDRGTDKKVPPQPEPKSSPLQRNVEQIVLQADLEGVTTEKLYASLPGATWKALNEVRAQSMNLVELDERIYHKDAFVDWEEGAQRMEALIDKLMKRNSGYISAAQLYKYASAEMSMFLNDNGMEDARKVYDFAQHLFEKERYHGKQYTFWMKQHISRGEVVTNRQDIARRFARERSGFFTLEELSAHLESVGVPSANLAGLLALGEKPLFFRYSSDEILSAESMAIDEAWLNRASEALKRLFEDQGDHVVLRRIHPVWFSQLPALPGNRDWTPLLLQYVLRFYGDKLGAKTIGAQTNANRGVLHAMLVTLASEVQTFADAVVAHLIDSGIRQRQFEAEDLRRLLVAGGLIAGNELTWSMPKAIGRDPRFAWDYEGKNVKIRV